MQIIMRDYDTNRGSVDSIICSNNLLAVRALCVRKKIM